MERSQAAAPLEAEAVLVPGEGRGRGRKCTLIASPPRERRAAVGTQRGQCGAASRGSSVSGRQTSQRAALWAGRSLSLGGHGDTGLCWGKPADRGGPGRAHRLRCVRQGLHVWAVPAGARPPAEAQQPL